ncbi:MAG: hypothetical protein EHM48_04525 [Planctomycetaceae bacterium]|nr:MAG: hypothetical protein EHM48_04525 [Planctomycetaceae bacterium]
MPELSHQPDIPARLFDRRCCLPILAACCIAVVLAGGGCIRDGSTASPSSEGGMAADSTEAAAEKAKRPVVFIIQVRIATIEVPVGTVSGSEELWSYLDESRMGIARTAGLGRNGLRVGVGKQGSWADVAGILTRLTGRSLQSNTATMFDGTPTSLVVRQDMPEQTIFLTNNDRTLSGSDFPPGNNVMTLTCTINADNPSEVMVTGLPQIVSRDQHAEIVRENNRPVWRMVATTYSFNSAMFRVMIPSEDFIVIGPGSESRRPHSVGNHFLIHQKKGVDFETVLILFPEVVATR